MRIREKTTTINDILANLSLFPSPFHRINSGKQPHSSYNTQGKNNTFE